MDTVQSAACVRTPASLGVRLCPSNGDASTTTRAALCCVVPPQRTVQPTPVLALPGLWACSSRLAWESQCSRSPGLSQPPVAVPRAALESLWLAGVTIARRITYYYLFMQWQVQLRCHSRDTPVLLVRIFLNLLIFAVARRKRRVCMEECGFSGHRTIAAPAQLPALCCCSFFTADLISLVQPGFLSVASLVHVPSGRSRPVTVPVLRPGRC